MALIFSKPWMMDKWAWFEQFWSLCHTYGMEAHRLGSVPHGSCAQRMEDDLAARPCTSLRDIATLLALDVAFGGT
jgi:hypothetical protein